MLELVDELVAGTATSGGGGSVHAVIEELNVTPSTSAQKITAPSGTDGYSPVNVSAVTSSIDANIQATNIKDGVSILGVTGTLLEGDIITAKNNTGSVVSEGDKVWVEYYSPSSERDDNIGSGTVYQSEHNGIIYMTGNGSRVARHGSQTNQVYIYDISGDSAPVQNGTFSAAYQNNVLNQFFEDNKFYARGHNTSGYTVFSEDGGQSISGNYYIGAGLYSDRLNVYDENNNIIYTLSGYSNGEITHAYQADTDHIILAFTEDYTYPNNIHKIDIINGTATISSAINLYPYSGLYSPRLGFTSDGKYFIVSQRQIINVSSWSVISSPNVFSTVNDNYKPYFNNIGNILTSKCTDGYIRSFKYNTSDETWSEITEIAVQSSGYVGLCNANGTILIYMASSDSSNASVNVKRSLDGELGWYALSFNNITQNTLTGYAQESIASGSTGEVLTLLPPEPASKKKRLVSVADNLDANKLVLYTDDGINWNTSTMPNSRNWGNPFYGDGKFIIANYSSEGIDGYATSRFAYSTDGINWTESTIRHNAGVSDYLYYIAGAYGNGLYVMAFSTSYGVPGIIYTSTDGINWSSGHSFYQQHNTIRKIFFDGNKFIACFDTSTSYPNALSYSTDGINWTDTGYLNMEYRFGDAVYNPDNQTYYAAVYQREGTTTKNQVIVSSSDLVNFTPISAINYNNVAPITNCILDGQTKIFSGWSSLSLQSAGYINIDSSGTATFVGSSVPRLNYQGGANVINGRAVVIGYGSDQYIYSTDGTTWNTGTLPASSGWWGSCVGEVD